MQMMGCIEGKFLADQHTLVMIPKLVFTYVFAIFLNFGWEHERLILFHFYEAIFQRPLSFTIRKLTKNTPPKIKRLASAFTQVSASPVTIIEIIAAKIGCK